MAGARVHPNWNARHAVVTRAQSRLRVEPLQMASPFRVAQQRLLVGLRRSAVDGRWAGDDGATVLLPRPVSNLRLRAFHLDVGDAGSRMAKDGGFQSAG